MILLVVAPVLQLRVPLQPVAVKVAVSAPQIVFVFVCTVGTVGDGTFVIVITLLAALSPQLVTHLAEYVPPALTNIEVPVEPLLHVIEPVAQPVAVKVAVSLLHNVFLLAVIAGAAGALPEPIVTIFDTPLVPQLFTHVALYVPAALTVILVPVELLLQVTVPLQPVATKVAVSLLHRLVLLLAMVGAFGVPPENIVMIFDTPLVPQAFVQVAEYVPGALTVILLPLAPVLHFTVPLQPAATKVAVSVPHNFCLSELIVGALGFVTVLITTKFDGVLPQLFSQFAE